MKILYAVTLGASLLLAVNALPAAKRESSEEERPVVVEDKEDGIALVLPNPRSRASSVFEDVFGDDSSAADEDDDETSMPGGMFRPFRFDNSFYDFPVASFRETLNKIKEQMAAALSDFKVGNLTPWGKIPEGANTTSTTKIINGHAVTVNETTYSNGDENGSTIFRVRVVDVKPVNDTDDVIVPENEESSEEEPSTQRTSSSSSSSTSSNGNDDNNNESSSEQIEDEDDKRAEETTPAPSRSVETVEEFNNEIPKSQVETLTA